MPVVRNSVKRCIHSGPRNGAILTDNTCELLLLPRYNSKPEKNARFIIYFHAQNGINITVTSSRGLRVKFEKTEVSRAGKRYETRRIPLTGGMKVGTVQYCVVDRTCHELFDTEWITKVHGKWSQRSACVRDRFRVLGSTARRNALNSRISVLHRASRNESRHLTGAKAIEQCEGTNCDNLPGKKEPCHGYDPRIKGCTFLILLCFVLIIIPVIPLMTKTICVLLSNLLLIYNASITHNREKQKNTLI